MPEILHDLSWVLPLRHDWLTPLMHGFTQLGYEKFILFFLPLGYWAWNKPLFLRLFLLVAFTAVFNAFCKDLWQDPRPELDYRMDHEVGESFGLPSGHAQIAVVLWLWLAYELRQRWMWLLSGVVVSGIIFSRLYLGAHDLEDVLGGALLGALTLIGFALVQPLRWWREANAFWHLGLVVLLALGFQLAWQGTAPHYVPLLAAMLVGVLLGYRLEGRWLDSHAQVATWRRLLAAALGAGAFVLLQGALKALADLWPLQDWLWQVVRGLIMGLFVAALMPWVLVRLRLLGARAPRPLASEVLE